MSIYRTHVTASDFNEYTNNEQMKIKYLDDGSVWARIHWLDVKRSSTYYSSTAEVLDINDTTRFSKMKLVDKLYSTQVSLTNLAPEIDASIFNLGSYGASSSSSLSGTTSLQITANSGAAETTISSKPTMPFISGHIYYVTYRIFQSSVVGTSEFFWPIVGAGSHSGRAATANTWTKVSNRKSNTTSTTGNYNFRFDFNNGSGNSGTMLFDQLMVIDLTADFGNGNEPSQSWCDTNIPFFLGKKTIDAASAGYKKYEFMLQFPEMNSVYTKQYYLQSSGTQYINTGVTTNQNTRIEIQAASTGNYSVYGAGAAWTNLTANANGMYFYYNDYGPGSSPPKRTNDGISHVFVQDKNACYIDGVPVHTFSTASFTSPGTLYLFGRNASGALGDAGGSVYIFYCKIYDNDVLIRDFIPVLDSNGVPCMLDRVTKTFYYNAGSGSFSSGGPNKNNMCILELYNRWRQTGSPNTRTPGGYTRIATQWLAHAGPLRTSTGSAMYDCDNSGVDTWFVPIGQTAAWTSSAAIPPAHGSAQTDAKNEIELWIRIDDLAPTTKASVFEYQNIIGAQFYEF